MLLRLYTAHRQAGLFTALTFLATLVWGTLALPQSAEAQSGCPVGQFRAEYFNNDTLSGTPTFTRCESAINYNWGNGGPGNGIPNDYFSVRWTGRFTYAAASSTFTTRSDDGVRVWVDNVVLIDRWTDHPPMTDTGTRTLTAGDHDVKVEYYERGGGAVIQLTHSGQSTQSSTCPVGQYVAQYYNNLTLSGTPTFTRCEAAINYNWGTGGPGNGIPSNYFSVRWTGRLTFAAGSWKFTTVSDDGVRLWVDNALLIDRWTNHPPTTDTGTQTLTAGEHEVKVEYYERDGGAVIQTASALVGAATAGSTPAPAPAPAPGPAPSGPVYYVDQTGNDASPGTEAQPFRTIRRGVQALRAGATLYVKSGTYAEYLDRIPGGTSWSAPVRVVAYPGHTVVLRPSGVARILQFQDSTTAYISVEGFVLDADYVSHDAVKISYGSNSANAAHHIRLLRCEIKNASGNGVLVTSGSNDNEFIELDVHHNGTNEYTHGFYIASSGNRVENSTIYQNGGTGVHLYAGSSTVNDNVVHGNWIASNARAGRWGPGISVNNGARNRIYNNMVMDNVRGIQVDYSAAETDIYNNTIYANTREGIFIGAGSADADVRNNIIYGNSGANYSEDGTRTTHSHNLIGVNPGFVNAGAGDYRLRADSLAVNAGMILPLVTVDHEGTPRPQHGAFDIGAFEFK